MLETRQLRLFPRVRRIRTRVLRLAKGCRQRRVSHQMGPAKGTLHNRQDTHTLGKTTDGKKDSTYVSIHSRAGKCSAAALPAAEATSLQLRAVCMFAVGMFGCCRPTKHTSNRRAVSSMLPIPKGSRPNRRPPCAVPSTVPHWPIAVRRSLSACSALLGLGTCRSPKGTPSVTIETLWTQVALALCLGPGGY